MNAFINSDIGCGQLSFMRQMGLDVLSCLISSLKSFNALCISPAGADCPLKPEENCPPPENKSEEQNKRIMSPQDSNKQQKG